MAGVNTMKSIAQISEDLFDLSVRIDRMWWLAALGDSLPEDLEEMIEDDPEPLEKILGMSIPSDIDPDSFNAQLHRKGKLGILVRAATPLPRNFNADGSGYSCGWGISTSALLYFDRWDPNEVFEALKKWQADVKERQWLKHQRERGL